MVYLMVLCEFCKNDLSIKPVLQLPVGPSYILVLPALVGQAPLHTSVQGMTMQHALSKLACTALGMTSFKLRNPLILVLSHL